MNMLYLYITTITVININDCFIILVTYHILSVMKGNWCHSLKLRNTKYSSEYSTTLQMGCIVWKVTGP